MYTDVLIGVYRPRPARVDNVDIHFLKIIIILIVIIV